MDLFEQFIREHGEDDTARLLLARDRWPDIDMDLAVHTIEGRRRIRRKLPDWYGTPGLVFPTAFCTQQSSSSATAAYKAALAGRTGARVIYDLTGGLGVDSAAFARIADRVFYLERDLLLARYAPDNFAKLGCGNITVLCRDCTDGPLPWEETGVPPQLVYLDPARRTADGSKVFRLEDGVPDIRPYVADWLEASPHLLLKLSPMADVTRTVRQLDEAAGRPCIREIHAVQAGGECKELLFWLDRTWEEGPVLLAADAVSGAVLSFRAEEEKSQVPRLLPASRNAGTELTGKLLFEPGKALAKTGCFNTLCSRFNLMKLGYSTQLYLAEAPVEAITPLGKWFRIREVCPLGGRSCQETGRRFPHAAVSARNLPLSSEQLARKMGIGARRRPDTDLQDRSDDADHVFGCTLDFQSGLPDRVLLVTRRHTLTEPVYSPPEKKSV